MTDVLTEPQLLRIPEKFFVDAELRVEIEQFLYFEASLVDERGTLIGIASSPTTSTIGCRIE